MGYVRAIQRSQDPVLPAHSLIGPVRCYPSRPTKHKVALTTPDCEHGIGSSGDKSFDQ
jgi:hypothetical protein